MTKYISIANVTIADEKSKDDEINLTEVFIDLTGAFKNRTKNIWARHFSINQATTYTFCNILTFTLLALLTSLELVIN